MSSTVLTTGVFDVLHPGHISLFKTIKRLYPSYQLVVGINGDRRAKELKPILIFSEDDRLEIVGSCGYVNGVVIFNEDTPAELIRIMRPGVFVKGGDYVASELPEKDACDEVGAEIVIIPLHTNIDNRVYSSSEIKERLSGSIY